MKQEICTKFSL